MDHIIPRIKFKNPMEADRMSNLQPVCTSCHRAKTKTDLKVLTRMGESRKSGSKRGDRGNG